MCRPVLFCLLLALPASAYEGGTYKEVDGGVHIPVLTKPPALLEFVQAEYPAQAQAAGKMASVKLLVTIGADGKVAEAKVMEPVGDGFDEAALAAVKKFTFSPAEIDNKPGAVAIEYVYNFVLQVVDAGTPEADAKVPAAELKPATIKGRLVTRGNRTPISGGIVRCADLGAESPEAISGEDGRFELTVPPGPCKVKVSANSYETYDTVEELKPGETLEVDYYVVPEIIGYQTIVKSKREKKEVVRRTLERNELQKIPGSFGDPVRVLQNFPGVARAPFILGALIVRGANPGQTLTYLDGVEIPALFHLGGGPSVISSEFIDKIDFYPGGFGARYGRAVGGAVDVSTRRGASDTWHGSLKIDIQDTGLFLEAPLTDEISVAGSVRRSYIDALLPLVLPQDPNGGALFIVPQYWDYQVRIDYGGKRGKGLADGKWSGFLMAFGSDDVLKVVATGGGRNRDVSVGVHTLFHRVVGHLAFRQGNATFKITPYLGYDNIDLDFGITKLTAGNFNLGTRADLEVEAAQWLTVRAGIDVLEKHLSGQAEIPFIDDTQYVGFPGAEPKAEVQRFSRELDTFDAAAYVEADFKLGKRLTITPGLRASAGVYHDQARHAFDPRLWARLKIIEDWTEVKGSVGLYSQPPQAFDMEPSPFGNPKLGHERAFQTSLGVWQKITDDINIDVTGFFNRRYENVGPGETTVNALGQVTQERVANTAAGRAYGMEILLRHEVSKYFFGWIAYTLSRSEETRRGETKYWLSGSDQTHILTFVGSLRLPFGFEFGARFRLVSGNPKTPNLHEADIYSVDGNRFFRQSGEFRSTRNATFHQLDLRLDKSFAFKHWTLGVYVDVQNVYNAKNVEGSFYDYRFREEFAVPGIPILPVFGIKGSF